MTHRNVKVESPSAACAYGSCSCLWARSYGSKCRCRLQGCWANRRARCSPRHQRAYGLDRTESNVIAVDDLGGGIIDMHLVCGWLPHVRMVRVDEQPMVLLSSGRVV